MSLVKFFNGVKPRYENDAPLGQRLDGSLVYIGDIDAYEHKNNDTTTMSEESLKYFVFASIISADNDEFTEEVKQEIISRFDEQSPDKAAKDAKEVSNAWNEMNWEYILEPIGDKEKIDRLVSILK